MNPTSSILSNNYRQINNALASNFSQNINKSPISSGYYQNYISKLITVDPHASQATPISISDAQRLVLPVFPYPNQIIDTNISHNSRLKQVMYDQEGGTKRIKNRSQLSFIPQKNNSKIVCCLLTILIIVVLSIFVWHSIKRHNKYPISYNSIGYNSELNKIAVTETLTTANNYLNPVPTIDYQIKRDYSETTIIALQNEINRKLRAGIIDSSDIRSLQPNGQCKQYYFQLNGICYPCKAAIGFQHITKCLRYFPNNNIPTSIPTAFHPVISLPQCPIGSRLVDGKCISCPPNTIWNGSTCQKILNHNYSSQNNLLHRHLKNIISHN